MNELDPGTLDPISAEGPSILAIRVRVKDVRDPLAAGAFREEGLEDFSVQEPVGLGAHLSCAWGTGKKPSLCNESRDARPRPTGSWPAGTRRASSSAHRYRYHYSGI